MRAPASPSVRDPTAPRRPGTRRARLAVGVVAGLMTAALPTEAAPTPQGPRPAPRFDRLDVAGLSHNSVYAITEDAEGFLWIGTADGLNRYDGYQFRVYRHDPRDSTTLSANVIYDLEPDGSGGLWIATAAGVDRFDPVRDAFERQDLGSVAASAAVREIYDLTKTSTGELWASGGAGLFRRRSGSAAFEQFPPDPRAVEERLVLAREDGDGRMWLLADRGGSWSLLRVGAGDALERVDASDVRGPLYDFFVDRAGRFWIGAASPALLDPVRRQLRVVDDPAVLRPAWSVHESPDGVVWIGTDEGLYRSDPVSGDVTHHLPDPSRTAYVFNHVRALYQDRSGTLWVGTHGGLYRADPRAKPFRHLAPGPGDPGDAGGPESGPISAMALDGDRLWLGTYGAGLSRVDRREHTVVRYRHDATDPASLPSDIVWAVHRAADGRVWVGTATGLSHFDPATEGFVTHAVPPGPDPRAARHVRAIAEAPGGRLWLASGSGLYGFDPGTGEARLYAPGDDSDPLTVPVESVLVEDDSTIWVGLATGELGRLDVGAGLLERHPLLTDDGERLRSEGVWALSKGGDGALWLGTGAGLTRFDPASGQQRHYLPRDGLPGSVVYSILEDASSRLWLGTNAGLARLDPRAPPGRRFRNFDLSDGIGNIEFNRRAALAAPGGEFIFGGMDGLTSFFPADIGENRYVPPVVFTSVETADREGVVSHNPRGLEHLVLSHRDYSLSFEVAALSFTNPGANRYAHRLVGFDRDWVDAGTRRFVRYTNVPPGEYTLRVRGSNEDGQWNAEGIALRLTITPPFWATWWFRVAAALLLLAALVAAYRARVARLLAIERLRLRIAGDLHDDLSSNLSAIALTGETIQRSAGLGPREGRQLSAIVRTAREMVESVRDIVWLVDPAHDHLDELVLRMKDLASMLLGDIEHEFRSDARPTTRLGPGFRRQIFLVYKEILHNVARHARASRAWIEVQEASGRFTLSVRDDGVGFDVGAGAAGLGLRSLRERTREMGGTIEVRSAPGRGTTIEVRVPVT